jgi:hypothetical protein
MSDALNTQLKRLNVSSPLVRKQVVAGVYQQLRSSSGNTQRNVKDVVATFLSHVFEVAAQTLQCKGNVRCRRRDDTQDVVAEGVSGLVDLVDAKGDALMPQSWRLSAPSQTLWLQVAHFRTLCKCCSLPWTQQARWPARALP